jgi:hypothetical protein
MKNKVFSPSPSIDDLCLELRAEGAHDAQLLMVVASFGFLRAIESGSMPVEFACCRYFSPVLLDVAAGTGTNEGLLRALNLCLDLESVERLLPEQTGAAINEIKSELLKTLQSIILKHAGPCQSWVKKLYTWRSQEITQELRQVADNGIFVRIGARGVQEAIIMIAVIGVGLCFLIDQGMITAEFARSRLSHDWLLSLPDEFTEGDDPVSFLKSTCLFDDMQGFWLGEQEQLITRAESGFLSCLKESLSQEPPLDQWFFMPAGRPDRIPLLVDEDDDTP